MTTELSIRPDQLGFDDTQRAALEALGIDKAPAGDQQLFMHVAQRSGLDPFAKQIYLIPRWDSKTNKEKWTIQTSIDGLRVIRDRIGKFQGLTTEWCGPDGVWRDVWLSKDKPAAARVSVYVTGFQVPIRGIALWTEYAQTTKQGNLTAMWNGKSTVMIAKCAEAIAYRQAFPQDFSGLYVQEEMPQDGVEQDHDGAGVVATMRDGGTSGRVKSRGLANETAVPQRPDREPTPAPSKRPGGSRTASKPAPGPAEPTRDKGEVFAEWAGRIAEADDIDSLIKLHAEAADRNVLDHISPVVNGAAITIEDAFLNRRSKILAGASQDAEDSTSGDEGTYAGEQLY